MRSLLPFMLVGTLLGAGLAIAQSSTADMAPDTPQPVVKFDALFHAADQDGDGAWTRDEALSARMHRIVEQFDRLDSNHDRLLTHEEAHALVRRPTI